MAPPCFKRHRFPPDVIRHAVWLYFRLTLSFREVDDEGEVLDLVVQKRRHTGAALKLLQRLLRNQRVEPESIVTDGLASYGSALKLLRLQNRHRPGRLRDNNRAENSHLPIRRLHERDRAPCTGLERDEFTCQSRKAHCPMRQADSIVLRALVPYSRR
jgi:transposase-like protein